MIRPTVAVVVCAYTLDRRQELAASIASAAGQTPAPDELVLVVDHNTELLGWAERDLVPAHPGLRVMPNQLVQGLSGARNTALAEVTSDVIVFLDDDAAAEPEWLARLLAPYADPAVIAVGGSATPRWPGAASRPVTLPSGQSGRGELDWVVGCTYQGQPERLAAVRNLMGCNMSFRREVVTAIGGFSSDLGRIGKTPLGCEETEYCIRASTTFPGGTILFEPGAMVRHSVSPDRLTWRYLRRRCYAEGLSKAVVSTMVGSDSALSTERDYARVILPRAILRELAALARWSTTNRRARLAGAAAIVVGFGATALGYLRGRLGAPTAMGTAAHAGARTESGSVHAHA